MSELVRSQVTFPHSRTDGQHGIRTLVCHGDTDLCPMTAFLPSFMKTSTSWTNFPSFIGRRPSSICRYSISMPPPIYEQPNLPYWKEPNTRYMETGPDPNICPTITSPISAYNEPYRFRKEEKKDKVGRSNQARRKANLFLPALRLLI